jgi:hydrophobe/amphiphile efflux-1 (HAE1) family protein
MGVRPNGLEDVPELKLDIDYKKASSMGVSFSSIANTLQVALGSSYVGDFLNESRVKQVYVQGIQSSRMLPSDINKWFVKNNINEMVPISSFITQRWVYGSPKLERFNGFSSVNIQGSAVPGISSGTAMNIMEQIAKKLPEGYSVSWQGVSYEERAAGSKAIFLYIISILIVFLSLAALYESWSIPISVLLSIPFGFLGALIFAQLRGLSNDIYFQIALLTTVGLSAKNAILIVEFAKELHEKGEDLVESILHSIKLRFRPIMMTSMAFILGVVPLALATGAGSNAQNAIGISVIGGMLFATFVAPIFVPLFYVFVVKLTNKKEV